MAPPVPAIFFAPNYGGSDDFQYFERSRRSLLPLNQRVSPIVWTSRSSITLMIVPRSGSLYSVERE